MSIVFYKWLGLVSLLVLIVGLAEYERRHIYNQGYQAAVEQYKLEAAKQDAIYRQKEKDMQDESDRKYAEYQQKLKELQDANNQLATASDGLRNTIATSRRRLSEASNCPAGVIETGTVGLDLFAECSGKYEELARETGRLADKTNALIDQLQK